MRPLLAALLAIAVVLGGGLAAEAATPGGRTEYRLNALYVSGRGTSTTTVVGNGGTVRLTPQLSWRYWSSTLSKPRIGLQRFDDGRWRALPAGSVRVPTDLRTRPIVVWTKPFRTAKATRAIRYRLVSRAYRDGSGWVSSTSHSRAFSVRYENQDAYTGLARTAWLAVRPYCPATAVRIGGVDGEERAGEFRTGASRIRLAAAVAGYPEAKIRSVALHECAHERQWLNYGSTTLTAATKAAARIYTDDAAPDGSSAPAVGTFDPIEHAADCASIAIEPDGYLGYGGWCDDAELAAGRRLMAGERY